MAQNINSITANGLFNSGEFGLTALTENSFSTDVSGCKDPITVIVDTTSDKSKSHTLVCLGADGKKDKEIKLGVGTMNAIRITTNGLKKADGFIDFSIEGGASAGIKVAFLKYVPVVNN